MCGIVAAIGGSQCLAQWLHQGLTALEYRGYDSFGIAFQESAGSVFFHKHLGAPSDFEQILDLKQEALLGLGHTRWATHGAVSLQNAHPHQWKDACDHLSLVHNGVVENLLAIQEQILPQIRDQLISQTDSERILGLIATYRAHGCDMWQSISRALGKIVGSYALVIADWKGQNLFIAAKDLPLYLSCAENTFFISSDLAALPHLCTEAVMLSHDMWCLNLENISQQYNSIRTEAGQNIFVLSRSQETTFLKETTYFEQEMLAQKELLSDILDQNTEDLFKDAQEIHFVGCGSSFFAASFMVPFFIQNMKIPVHAFLASDYRDIPPLVKEHSYLVALSQSGETADILGLMREHGHKYEKTIALTNRSASSLTRQVDQTILLNIGPEYSVAATKSFTAQILHLTRCAPSLWNLGIAPNQLYTLLESVLSDQTWQEWAKDMISDGPLILLARGYFFPIAQESCLKIRELSYKNAFAIHSGELKHGSLALIDSHVDVLLYLAHDTSFEKNLIAAQEVIARGGRLKVISELQGHLGLPVSCTHSIMQSDSMIIKGLVFSCIGQMLAFWMAQHRGCNIDKPRNLAKSVTVD